MCLLSPPDPSKGIRAPSKDIFSRKYRFPTFYLEGQGALVSILVTPKPQNDTRYPNFLTCLQSPPDPPTSSLVMATHGAARPFEGSPTGSH